MNSLIFILILSAILTYLIYVLYLHLNILVITQQHDSRYTYGIPSIIVKFLL